MTPGRRSPLAVALLIVIRLYRVIRHGRPSPCRFTPTCSAFGAEAIITYGAVRGGWLTLRRIARCRPGGGMGFDPVPTPEPHVHDSPTTRKAAHV